jgi:hypothetical protein
MSRCSRRSSRPRPSDTRRPSTSAKWVRAISTT